MRMGAYVHVRQASTAKVISRTVGCIHGIDVFVAATDVDPLAVITNSRGRIHHTAGRKVPDLAAGRCIDGVEVAVIAPDVNDLAVTADGRGGCDRATGRKVPQCRSTRARTADSKGECGRNTCHTGKPAWH